MSNKLAKGAKLSRAEAGPSSSRHRATTALSGYNDDPVEFRTSGTVSGSSKSRRVKESSSSNKNRFNSLDHDEPPYEELVQTMNELRSSLAKASASSVSKPRKRRGPAPPKIYYPPSSPPSPEDEFLKIAKHAREFRPETFPTPRREVVPKLEPRQTVVDRNVSNKVKDHVPKSSTKRRSESPDSVDAFDEIGAMLSTSKSTASGATSTLKSSRSAAQIESPPSGKRHATVAGLSSTRPEPSKKRKAGELKMTILPLDEGKPTFGIPRVMPAAPKPRPLDSLFALPSNLKFSKPSPIQLSPTAKRRVTIAGLPSSSTGPEPTKWGKTSVDILGLVDCFSDEGEDEDPIHSMDCMALPLPAKPQVCSKVTCRAALPPVYRFKLCEKCREASRQKYHRRKARKQEMLVMGDAQIATTSAAAAPAAIVPNMEMKLQDWMNKLRAAGRLPLSDKGNNNLDPVDEPTNNTNNLSSTSTAATPSSANGKEKAKHTKHKEYQTRDQLCQALASFYNQSMNVTLTGNPDILLDGFNGCYTAIDADGGGDMTAEQVDEVARDILRGSKFPALLDEKPKIKPTSTQRGVTAYAVQYRCACGDDVPGPNNWDPYMDEADRNICEGYILVGALYSYSKLPGSGMVEGSKIIVRVRHE